MLLPPPDKHTLEMEVDGFFRNGDKKDVARFVQKDSSTVSRQLSPNCEHNNHVVYWFVQCLWAFDMIRRELGDSVINLVIREREKWLVDEPIITEHPAKLTGKVGEEFTEAIVAEISGHDADTQIGEWTDVINAATAKRNALIGLRASSFNGNPILPKHVTTAVSNRRGSQFNGGKG